MRLGELAVIRAHSHMNLLFSVSSIRRNRAMTTYPKPSLFFAALGMFFLAGISASISTCAANNTRPNILLITVDDLGMQLGCYGDFKVTPNIDLLASQGILYANAHCAQSSCSSSRAAVLMGMPPHQSRQVGLAQMGFRTIQRPSLPGLLRNAGYLTGIAGKLHVGPESHFPFEVNYGLGPFRDPYWLRDRSTQFFRDAKARNKPFFFYLNIFDPHSPYDAAADQVRGIPPNPFNASNFSYSLPFAWVPENQRVQATATFYNCIRRADAIIGMVMASLANEGLQNNTVVIFVSDNGPAIPRGKQNIFELSTRVPMLIRWPNRIPAGQIRTEPVGLIDIFPTALRLAGVSIPSHQSGMVLEGVFNEPLNPLRGWVFTENNFHNPGFFRPQRAVRGRQFRLIQTYRPPPEAPRWELYNLYTDPNETNNLINNANFASRRDELKTVLNNWQVRTQDPFLDPNKLRVWFQKAEEWKSTPQAVINASQLPF